MGTHRYRSGLGDAGWVVAEAVLPPGHRGRHPVRGYVARNGIAWRALPAGFPAWRAVCGFFDRWKNKGVTARAQGASRGGPGPRGSWTILKTTVETTRENPGRKTSGALPGRGVVERTLAWLTAHRRLAHGYGRHPAASESFINGLVRAGPR
ncbi:MULTISPECIES: transposase [Frankia]|uniref:Insertion element IS402-like domain-containing protein n=2 Tax=Frankia TaxID=1854 RepID=Q2JEF0_FRACC|nr:MULTISPECIES: transposase [Frankia]ABD10342.1 hypothetical protein Francci3_0958 [Frankia casuarinae]